MRKISKIEFHIGSKEELLPDFMSDFPYIASQSDLSRYPECLVPWHWHKAVELFYLESGSLEYFTPNAKHIFTEGCGGMINSNILHMTRSASQQKNTTQFLHIFDPSLIAGEQGSRIEQRYVIPVTTCPQVEIIPLSPEDSFQSETLTLIRNAFTLSPSQTGYEIQMREALSEIWLRLFEQITPLLQKPAKKNSRNDKIKSLMVYIHEHYAEKLSISELAAASFLSERECYRIFQDSLHMTPNDYIRNYRLQTACQLLARTNRSITDISHSCGLGSSSYFGKVFRDSIGYSPSEYRQKWQDFDTKRQK